MSKTIPLEKSFAKWRKDPKYVEAYSELEPVSEYLRARRQVICGKLELNDAKGVPPTGERFVRSDRRPGSVAQT